MPIPCQKGGMGVEMRVLVQISPIVLFPDRFRVKPFPSKQNNGVENLPKKDLVRGPVCWAKMAHFWKPWKQAFWPPPECREPFNVLPRHALSSFMVWNAGVGPWWAATAEILKKRGSVLSCLTTNPTRSDDSVASILKFKTISPQEDISDHEIVTV